MSQPKDYDSTLARMAGNIAAGLIGRNVRDLEIHFSGYPTASQIAAESLYIAEQIIVACRDKYAPPMTEKQR